MNIYLSNLPYAITAEDLRKIFEAFGQVDLVTIVKDRATGKPNGFGLVGHAET